MQEEIGDVLLKKDHRIQYQLSTLLDICTDELEMMVSQELGEADIIPRLRKRIEKVYGLEKSISQEIQLGEFVAGKIEELRPRFCHRKCRLRTHISVMEPVWIPPDVLGKVVEGLVRNAIENTPDESWIDVTVRPVETGSEFEVKDNGVGITQENQDLILKNYFTAYEPKHYSSREPYDFNAGGKGFDLARMKVFSERYHFKIQLASTRCGNISNADDVCPGNVNDCAHYKKLKKGPKDRGTTVKVQFYPSQQFDGKQAFLPQ